MITYTSAFALMPLVTMIIYYDLRYKTIPNVFLAGMGMISLYVLKELDWPQERLFFLGTMICIMIILSLWERSMKRTLLGDGDKILFICSMAWLNLFQLPLFFILCGLGGILTSIIWRIIYKDQYFPFAPAILFGLLMMYYAV